MAELPLSLRYRSKIGTASQVKADSDMALAAIYKEAEEVGLHRAALKLCCKLSRQDLSKTTAFLEAFDEYRADFGLDDQERLAFPEEEQAEYVAEPDIAGAMLEAIEADGGADNVRAFEPPRRARGRRASGDRPAA
jgi:hypothetical protein